MKDQLIKLLKERGVVGAEKKANYILRADFNKKASLQKESLTKGSLLVDKAFSLGQSHAKLYSKLLSS